MSIELFSGSPAPRRAIGATAAYAAVLAALAGASFWLLADLNDRLGQLQMAEGQLESLSSRFRVSVPQTAGPGTRLPFLEGRTITVAGASLQERMAEAVARAGGSLISSDVDVDGPEAKDGFVRLTANLEIAQPALQSVLYDIEAGMPYVFIDKVTVQAPEQFGEPETGRLRVTLGVTAQWRSSE